MQASKKNILLITALFCFINSIAQDKSNKGKEFWLGYGHNILFTQGSPPNSQTHVLYLSAEQAATVTVSVNGTGWSQTVNIPANTVDFSIQIPKSGADDARILAEGIFNRGIHIVSNVPIVAYSHQYGTVSSAGTMLMPVETYGYTYYSLNYNQLSNFTDCYSWFYVVAAEDNTRLEITPSDSTQGGWLPGVTYTVNLNKGQLYNVFGKKTGSYTGKDMTGSKIVSVAGADGNCHPVAVFSGSSRNIICNTGNGGEVMQQQIFPANAWGTKYVTYHTINSIGTPISNPFMNYYRVAVRNPSTIVKRNGVVMTGLVNNFYYEFQSNSGDIIEADQPVLVAQYTLSDNQCTGSNSNPYGDPEMIYLSPVEQGVKKAVFYNTRNQAIDLNFANIITSSVAISSLRIDGAALSPSEFIPHPVNSNYSVAVKRFIGPAAQHTITCDSSFIATAYGVGFVESYGYNVGTMVNNLNAITSIRNTLNTTNTADSFTCPKSPFRLYVNLAYRATQIHWKLSQTAGLFPNADSIINNPIPLDSPVINGRKYYRYTLSQDFIFNNAGTYFIPFTYTAPDIDACNQAETDVIKVVVKPGPVADFSISSPACHADSIYFTGTANAGSFTLHNYLWDFPDLSTQTTVNAVKKFNTYGMQQIRYRVYAGNGCIGDTTKPVTINETPLANFGISNTVCERDSAMITDSSTITTGGIATWNWNFGDGTVLSSSGNNSFYHPYNTAGTYTASLIVTSAAGCKSDTAFRNVTVLPKPTARFGYNRNICVGDSILFSDSSTLVAGSIFNRYWNFGDGTTAIYTNNNPFYHTYLTPGTYSVSLVVSSSASCISDTFRLNVIVANKPSATVSLSGKDCMDSIHTFISSLPAGSNPAPTWYWDFGDGQTFSSTTSNLASHSYSNTLSNIIVKHVVGYGAGCTSDTVYSTIAAIHPNPVADFTIIADTACVNNPVRFSSSNTNISVWNWNFGNAVGNNAPPFSRIYGSAGNYTISLSVISMNGCASAPVTKSLTIHPNPLINAGPDKIIVPGGTVTLDAINTTPGNYHYTWSPATGLNASNILNPAASPLATTEYILSAIDAVNNCMATDKVIVSVITGLYIPNAFTPNQDGLNDKWQIPGLAVYPDAEVMIYSRYGELVYKSRDYYNHPWDGKYKGIKQSTGTFVYMVKLNDAGKQILKGTVTIIR